MSRIAAIKDFVEPSAFEAIQKSSYGFTPSADAVITLSIAVSLKRIADELCGNPERCGLTDTLFEIGKLINK